MSPFRTTAALCSLMFALSACQTSSANKQAVYEDPLRQKGMLTAIKADGSSLSDGIDTYRLSDLEPGQRPSDDTTEGGLWYITDKAEKRVRTAGNRITDPALNTYVQRIACELAREFCSDIRVYVMRVPAFNASMAPNGMMQIWSGFLLRAENEAQFAAVVGHEIGHYLRRHSLQRFEDIRTKTSAAAVFGIITAGLGVGLIGTMAQVAIYGEIFAYSRDQEREADGYGLLLMTEAGYDPREYAVIWDKLIVERDATLDEDEKDDKRRNGFFATHPQPEERQATLKELGEALAATRESWTLGRETYLQAVLPHRAIFVRDELKAQRYDAILARLDMMLALAGEPNPAELHFFKGEAHRLRRESGDRKKAAEAYEAALSAEGAAPPEIYRSMGLVYDALNDEDRAYKAFQRYLDAVPEASDAAIIRDVMKTLSVSKNVTS